MGISQMIRNKREQFRQMQHDRSKETMMRHNAELQKERDRQTEMLHLHEERIKMEQEIGHARNVSVKGTPPQNVLSRLGQGMAKFMNQQNEATVRSVPERKGVFDLSGPNINEPKLNSSPFERDDNIFGERLSNKKGWSLTR